MKSNKDVINIAFSCDDNYIKFLAATISSLICNINSARQVEVIIFESGVSILSKDKILKLSTSNVKISFFYIDETIFKDYPITCEHITLAGYYRLKFPDLLVGYDKLLYLDVDILINKDISLLWDMDINNYAAAAVIEPDMSLNKKEYLQSIGIDNESYMYFNSGVLLLNLKYLREGDFNNQVNKYMEIFKDKIKFQDQDILNAVIGDKIKYISPIYNFMPMYKNILSRRKRDSIKYLPYTIEEIKGLNRTACIYHYCGKRKAWMDTCTHYGFDLYIKFLNNTAWKGSGYESNPNISLFKALSYKIKRFKIKLNSIVLK